MLANIFFGWLLFSIIVCLLNHGASSFDDWLNERTYQKAKRERESNSNY